MQVAQNSGGGIKVKVPTASTAPASTPSAPTAPVGGAPKDTSPDLTSLLSSDPGYIQAKSAYTAATGAAGGALGQGITQALINFGAVPDLASIAAQYGLTPDEVQALTGAIPANTGELAAQNTQSGDSVLARLQQTHDEALNSLRASLAGRGMLESGATGIGTKLEDQNYNQGMYDAYQTLMSTLTGDYGNYTSAMNAASGNLATAAGDAYSRAEAQAQKTPAAYIPPATVPVGTTNPTPAQKTILDNAAVAAGEPISEHGLGMGDMPAATAVKKAASKPKPPPYLGPH